jgi:hypothetical protein
LLRCMMRLTSLNHLDVASICLGLLSSYLLSCVVWFPRFNILKVTSIGFSLLSSNLLGGMVPSLDGYIEEGR